MRVPFPLLAAAFVAAALACGAPLRQDELDCEEAVSVLDGCCPGFEGAVLQCRYDNQGCSGTTYPALSTGDSSCIRGESCATLVASGVCDRAQAARSYVLGDSSNPDAVAPPPVCP